MIKACVIAISLHKKQEAAAVRAQSISARAVAAYENLSIPAEKLWYIESFAVSSRGVWNQIARI